MLNLKKLIAGACIFGLVSSVAFQGGEYLIDKVGSQNTEKTAANLNMVTPVKLDTTSLSSSSDDLSDVSEQVLPSIVAIDVIVVNKSQDFFGRTYEQKGQGSGSGIIFKEDDDYIYVVTNNHVVENSQNVKVTFNDKTSAEAEVVGTDSNVDIAVAKIKKDSLKDDTLSNIKVATFANSDDVKVGARAIAIGNALGYGISVTGGYVSAKDREIGTTSSNDNTNESGNSGRFNRNENDDNSAEQTETVKLIQTDAAINPGNSGGALVDAAGRVIGINSAKFASEEVEGMGFAIPSSKAVEVVNNILEGKGDKLDNNTNNDNNDDVYGNDMDGNDIGRGDMDGNNIYGHNRGAF